MSVTRRLLLTVAAALLVATGLVTVAAAPALARCPTQGGTAAQAKRATDVFTGVLGDHRDQGGKHSRKTVWTVEVERVYKGSISATAVDVTAPTSTRDCGLTGGKGDRYLLFAQRNGTELTVARGDGTEPANATNVAKVEDLFGSGHSPIPPEPIQATFTMVTGDPVDFQRLAAPGVALVIIGLLGLGLASWRGRRAA